MEQEFLKIADLVAEKLSYCHKTVLTSVEAAKYMGISLSTLYKMTMRKQIPHSKPNGKVCYFDRLELENWLMSNRVATDEELSMQAASYSLNKKKGGRL